MDRAFKYLQVSPAPWEILCRLPSEKLVKKLEDSKFILDKVTDKDDVIGRK
jgi:hypothetical protein